MIFAPPISMTPIVNYIQQLLLTHECVTIPQLGAFITNTQKAKVDFMDQSILPPAKRISFNRSIAQNDGLLIQFISQAEQLTYDQATTLVKQWVALIHARLNQKEIIDLQEIGTLRLDFEGNIQFQESLQKNYDLQAFGLPKLHLQPIVKESRKVEAIENFVKQQNDAIHEALTPFPHPVSETKKKRGWAVAAVVLVLLGLVSGSTWFVVEKTPTCNWIQQSDVVSFLKNSSWTSFPNSAPAKPAVNNTLIVTTTEATSENKSTEVEAPVLNGNVLPHHYSYYLNNPSQEYYLIFHETTDRAEAEKLRLKYRMDGRDTRILQIDSTYQVTFYFFKKKSEIDSIKKYFEDTCHLNIQVFSKALY